MRIKLEVRVEDRVLLQCEACAVQPEFEVLTMNRVVTEEKESEWRAIDLKQHTEGWIALGYVNGVTQAQKTLCPSCAHEYELGSVLND